MLYLLYRYKMYLRYFTKYFFEYIYILNQMFFCIYCMFYMI